MRTEEKQSARTTIELPRELWKRAKYRAVDDDTDFRSVVIAALEQYLGTAPAKKQRRG
jgi:hypothetical protein